MCGQLRKLPFDRSGKYSSSHNGTSLGNIDDNDTDQRCAVTHEFLDCDAQSTSKTKAL